MWAYIKKRRRPAPVGAKEWFYEILCSMFYVAWIMVVIKAVDWWFK